MICGTCGCEESQCSINKFSVVVESTIRCSPYATDKSSMVVAADVALCATIGASTVEPQLLVRRGSNTLEERCIFVVRASSAVPDYLSSCNLDEQRRPLSTAAVEGCPDCRKS